LSRVELIDVLLPVDMLEVFMSSTCLLLYWCWPSFAIIHLQETHLDKSMPTSEILDPARYEIVRKDRTCKKGHEGGGVINAVCRYDDVALSSLVLR
jgi:hypothetical protein